MGKKLILFLNNEVIKKTIDTPCNIYILLSIFDNNDKGNPTIFICHFFFIFYILFPPVLSDLSLNTCENNKNFVIVINFFPD